MRLEDKSGISIEMIEFVLGLIIYREVQKREKACTRMVYLSYTR